MRFAIFSEIRFSTEIKICQAKKMSFVCLSSAKRFEPAAAADSLKFKNNIFFGFQKLEIG